MLIGITGYDGLIVTLVASGVLFLLIQCLCKKEKTPLASEREDDIGQRRRSPAQVILTGWPGASPPYGPHRRVSCSCWLTAVQPLPAPSRKEIPWKVIPYIVAD